MFALMLVLELFSELFYLVLLQSLLVPLPSLLLIKLLLLLLLLLLLHWLLLLHHNSTFIFYQMKSRLVIKIIWIRLSSWPTTPCSLFLLLLRDFVPALAILIHQCVLVLFLLLIYIKLLHKMDNFSCRTIKELLV